MTSRRLRTCCLGIVTPTSQPIIMPTTPHTGKDDAARIECSCVSLRRLQFKYTFGSWGSQCPQSSANAAIPNVLSFILSSLASCFPIDLTIPRDPTTSPLFESICVLRNCTAKPLSFTMSGLPCCSRGSPLSGTIKCGTMYACRMPRETRSRNRFDHFCSTRLSCTASTARLLATNATKCGLDASPSEAATTATSVVWLCPCGVGCPAAAPASAIKSCSARRSPNSTSWSSMRAPWIFTCRSRRPRTSRIPFACQTPRSPERK
mmetsp:Transcript_35459/g.64961  ORF Transcript_35459/g.64961 Transcript_35459/m.64961 type:complete len:263 (+) Transcript_35459:1196-1984(+)